MSTTFITTHDNHPRMKKMLLGFRMFICFCTFIFVSHNVSSQWGYVGGNVTFNNAYAPHYSFAKDNADTLYAAFADLGNTYVVTVRKLVGTAWQTVGTPGFITGSGLFYNPGTSIAINPIDNVPYLAISDGDHDNKISVMKFNGASWVYVGIAGFSSPSACNIKLVFTSAGVPYVSFNDCYNGSGISVMRFSNGTWNYAGQQDFAYGNYVQPTAAPDNSISVTFSDQAYANKLSVMKLTSGAWTYAGNPGFSDDVAENTSITADSASALYVSYSDYSHSGKITVKKLVANVWTTLGAPSFSNFSAASTDISINRYGVPYVSYVEGSFPVGYKFKNGNWLRLGNYIATTSCSLTSILNDTLGNPIVLMALQPSSTLPFFSKYSPCNDTDYHFIATAQLDSAITSAGGTTTLKVTATGGIAPYNGTGTFTVTAGSYTYTVTDRNGCTTTVNINVTEPCTQNYWIGGVSNAWEDPANWSCGTVPNNNTDVVVNSGTVMINANTTVKSLRVNPGATLTVKTGFKLTVAH